MNQISRNQTEVGNVLNDSAHSVLIPISGTDPCADSDSWSPTDCSDRNCCGSSRSTDGHSCHPAECNPSGRPESARIVLMLRIVGSYPAVHRPLDSPGRCLPHRLRAGCPTAPDSAPRSRTRSCWHRALRPRVRSASRSTVFPPCTYASWCIHSSRLGGEFSGPHSRRLARMLFFFLHSASHKNTTSFMKRALLHDCHQAFALYHKQTKIRFLNTDSPREKASLAGA